MCHTNYFIKHMGILGQRCGRPQAFQAHISKKKKKKCKTNSQICTFVFIHESIPRCVTWSQGGVKCSLEYLEYDFSTDQINSLINHTMCQTLNI